MSGVEIAGFVLGAIPLMISALEHYKDTAEVLDTWWKVKREWRKCKHDLKYHMTTFEENLEELLLPLIVDEERMKRLLENPGGPEWKDPALEILLKGRLPKTYSSYLDTMQEMKEVVNGLNDALGIGKVHFESRVTEDIVSVNCQVLMELHRFGRVLEHDRSVTTSAAVIDPFGC